MTNRQSGVGNGWSGRLGWRILRRSLTLKRPQVLVTLLILTIGAAVAAMLLNLYGDAQVKMTHEFRSFGPNLILSSNGLAREGEIIAEVQNRPEVSLMGEGVLEEIRRLSSDSHRIIGVGILHAVARARNVTGQGALRNFGEPVIVVGTDFTLLHQLYSAWRLRDGVVV